MLPEANGAAYRSRTCTQPGGSGLGRQGPRAAIFQSPNLMTGYSLLLLAIAAPILRRLDAFHLLSEV